MDTSLKTSRESPRQATLAADAILKLLDEDPARGMECLRNGLPLAAAIVRSYLEDELPDGTRMFNPTLVARVERVRSRFGYARSACP
jgi:hypothetical protein